MPSRTRTLLLAACLLALVLLLPSAAEAQTASNGGISYAPITPGPKAKVVHGIAYPPAGAPPQVVGAINAANQIVRKPYRLGGGHGSFVDKAYDCSGSVSYALHGGGMLTAPLDSSSFMTWGLPGPGQWITVYTNPGHAFVIIAGLRFDTGWRDKKMAKGAAPGTGPRWGGPRPTKGYTPRHPLGL